MGTGVAAACLSAGHRVCLVDNAPDQFQSAATRVRQQLAAASLLGRTRSGGTTLPSMEGLHCSPDLADVAACDVIVDNTSEDVATKAGVIRRLDELCPQGTLIAVNTSAIPIHVLATGVRYPDRIVGTHFMNPVMSKMTVEVIPGEATSQATVQAALEFLGTLAKTAVIVRDSPGFVSNRVLMLTVNEATRLLDEGVASAEDVDRIFVGCFGHPMGPLATADLIGLDVVQASLLVLHQFLGDDRYLPTLALRARVTAGDLGRKSGEGFFRYAPTDRRDPPG